MVTLKRLSLIVGGLLFSSSLTVKADHSVSEGHLLDTETTVELCKRVLHEGKVIGMHVTKNGGYETVIYFGGSLYQTEFHLGLRSIVCRAYRISPTTRQLPKPG